MDIAVEMNTRLDGKWCPEPEDEELQKKAHDLFPARHFDGTGFPGRIGAVFLRQNKHLMK